MADKQKKPKDIVVFKIVRDSKCSECGEELWRGRLLKKEGDGVLCMSCADLDHLAYLHRGDAALTRRASEYSTLRAVVVKFSRTRKRYERQGILVEEEGLDRAEEECLADADIREARKAREAERREWLDKKYIDDFASKIRELYPSCPKAAETRIAEHACRKYSGRVGRTAAAKDFEPHAIELAVKAHIRHVHTEYDKLLSRGHERYEARDMVSSELLSTLEKWRQSGEAK